MVRHGQVEGNDLILPVGRLFGGDTLSELIVLPVLLEGHRTDSRVVLIIARIGTMRLRVDAGSHVLAGPIVEADLDEIACRDRLVHLDKELMIIGLAALGRHHEFQTLRLVHADSGHGSGILVALSLYAEDVVGHVLSLKVSVGHHGLPVGHHGLVLLLVEDLQVIEEEGSIEVLVVLAEVEGH